MTSVCENDGTKPKTPNLVIWGDFSELRSLWEAIIALRPHLRDSPCHHFHLHHHESHFSADDNACDDLMPTFADASDLSSGLMAVVAELSDSLARQAEKAANSKVI